jgi:hypothetical protein
VGASQQVLRPRRPLALPARSLPLPLLESLSPMPPLVYQPLLLAPKLLPLPLVHLRLLTLWGCC